MPVYCSCTYWTYEIGSIRSSGLSSVHRLSRCYLGIESLGFSEFRHGARNPYQVMHNRARFFGKTFLPQNLRKWANMRPKIGFFEFKEKFGC